MKNEKIIEEMARLDGLKQPFYVGDKVYNNCGSVQDYLNSHDACQRVIDKMDFDDLIQMDYEMSNLISVAFEFWKATPRQKCEAILKAYDKWEEEDKSNEVR